MKLAIMQPYFFPYIGYFQLIAAVDLFIVYDNVKYTKKGWINRNRYLLDGQASVFTIPLRNDSDFLEIRGRCVAESFERESFLARLWHAYSKAPFVEPVFEIIRNVISKPGDNLFHLLHESIMQICTYLEIRTPIVISSHLAIDHSLRGQEKVIALCKNVNASTYINPIGGRTLYQRSEFAAHGIQLCFLKSKPIRYEQFGGEFVPDLSILDVMMFNSPERIRDFLASEYELVSNS